jgi:16S rRNA (cytosine967-C5)-methyltransferase
MLARAPIDLRANSLRSTRAEVLRELAALGFAAEAAPIAPHGIRLNPAAGLNALHETELFKHGAFEFQDEGSQIVAHLLGAQPGERILDYAAGAGGKALAVAADMENLGEVVAFDAHSERMKPLPDRAARAGVTMIRPVTNRGPDWAGADFAAVLVDAPCSGSGTWRRNPDAKWRLTPAALERFKRAQAEMLDDAAGFVRPGGRLIYATCSLLCCENEDAVEGFLSRNRAFQRIKVKDVWHRLFAAELPGGSGHDFRASPFKTGTDGFFASIMQRRE